MAPYSSTLAWKIPWTEEPGRLKSVELQRVRHDWATSFTFHFPALEEEMATHSSVLAWRIPGIAEPGGLLSLGSHRVRQDWSDLAAVAACCCCYLVTQSCSTLCDTVDFGPPGSSVHGTLQSRTLEWVAISYSMGPSPPRDRTQVFCIADRFFTVWAIRKAQWAPCLVLTRPNYVGFILPFS